MLTAFLSFFVSGFPDLLSSLGGGGGWGAENVTAFIAFSISGSVFDDILASLSRLRYGLGNFPGSNDGRSPLRKGLEITKWRVSRYVRFFLQSQDVFLLCIRLLALLPL